MKRFLIGLILSFSFCQNFVCAKQVLSENILKITSTIEQPLSGGKGKMYFLCKNNIPCSTEQAAKEYLQNQGYKVMRGEVTFWQGMFALAFYDEIFSFNTNYYNDIPTDMFSDDFYPNRKESIDKKYKFLKSTNISEFINEQLIKYASTNTRLLKDALIGNSIDCIEFFKTPIVQEFLRRIDNKTFAKIVYRIAQNPNDNRAGTPDFVVWNEKELIFVEVKREKEKLRGTQIVWLQFLIKNRIPAQVLRIKGIP